MRRTEQKSAIRRVLEVADRPLSPREILDEARRFVPGLGIATVYRNLKALLTDGFLTPVELPGKTNRYELAGKQHHHHFHCRTCDRVFEVLSCPPGLERMTPAGFRLSGHELVLFGECAQCGGERAV